MRQIITLLLLAAAALVVTAGLAAAAKPVSTPGPTATSSAAARATIVRDCDAWASYPNIKISSARDMTCRAAVRDMRAYRGNISRVFHTPGGFRCARVSGGPLGGQWRCADRPRAYRFEFGD